MSKIKSIALLSACFAVLATGFASNPTARDVGPPGTESAEFKNVCVSPAFDLVVTDAYLLANPAELVIVSTDPGYVFVSKEDPAPAATPGTTVKSRSNLAFLDRHRRSGNYVGKYTNTEEADLTTKHNALKFTDRHRRIRA